MNMRGKGMHLANLIREVGDENMNIPFLKKFPSEEFVFAYSNRCIDGKYVVFLDYDDITPAYVYENIKSLQVTFNLSDFYVFSSSINRKGCHAVCLDKVNLKTLIRIMKHGNVDEFYIDIPKFFKKHWLLRLSEKKAEQIKFLGQIFSNTSSYERSNAHRILLNNLFDIGILKDKTYDNHTKLFGAFYPLDKRKYLNVRLWTTVFNPKGKKVRKPIRMSNNEKWNKILLDSVKNN